MKRIENKNMSWIFFIFGILLMIISLILAIVGLHECSIILLSIIAVLSFIERYVREGRKE